MFDYPVTLTPDGDTVLVTFADVPEAITFGIDEQDALRNAVDALEAGLSFYVDARMHLPVPSVISGAKMVRPSVLESIKLGIYQEMMGQGMRKADLARKMGWKPMQVDRLFNLGHASRLDQLEAAARVLGKRIDVGLV